MLKKVIILIIVIIIFMLHKGNNDLISTVYCDLSFTETDIQTIKNIAFDYLKITVREEAFFQAYRSLFYEYYILRDDTILAYLATINWFELLEKCKDSNENVMGIKLEEELLRGFVEYIEHKIYIFEQSYLDFVYEVLRKSLISFIKQQMTKPPRILQLTEGTLSLWERIKAFLIALIFGNIF